MKTHDSCIVVQMGLILMVACTGFSQTVSHIANPGTEHNIIDLAGFMATGEDMGPGRLLVTAHFSADLLGPSETVPWNPTGIGAGAAVGTGWRLDEAGDTWDSLWRLSADSAAQPIFGLVLEGFAETDETVERGIVFDRTDPFFGTDGSARGRDLDPFASAGNWDALRVVYFDEVDNLAHTPPPSSPVGDIYRAMSIQFGNLIEIDPLPLFDPVPFLGGDELLFLQDTDLVGIRDPNGGPGEEGLPEPSTIVLLAIGLSAATWSYVRR